MTETIAEPRGRRSVRATDTTAQKAVVVSDIALDLSIGELIQGLLPRMAMQRKDSSGRALEYGALSPRLGRHLRPSERVEEVLEEDDEIVLTPSIEAGGLEQG